MWIPYWFYYITIAEPQPVSLVSLYTTPPLNFPMICKTPHAHVAATHHQSSPIFHPWLADLAAPVGSQEVFDHTHKW